MSVLVPHEKIEAVKTTLAAVRSNGQAAAVVQLALQSAAEWQAYLRELGGPMRESAARDLGQYADRVRVYQRELSGAPTLPTGPTWNKAKEQVMSLYMLGLTLESTMPEGVDLGDGWAPALEHAVTELPRTVGKAAKVAANVVQTVVKETAKVGGSAVWGIVAGAWPLLLVLGVGAAVYLVAVAKVRKAVVP